MTAQINIHEAKTHLSKLLQRVIAGEEIDPQLSQYEVQIIW